MAKSEGVNDRLIILFRHGVAEPRQEGAEDAQRRLTDDGRDKTTQAAHGLVRLLPSIGRILSSPYTRCVETARILRDALGGEVPLDLVESLAPGASVDALLAHIRPLAASEIVVIGHEPDLTDIMESLTGVSGLGVGGLRKAGAYAIRLGADGRAQVEWIVTSRILRRVAG